MTDWNRRWQVGDTPWDKGRATPVLDEIAARQPAALAGRVLVPGCGAGWDARWIGARGAGEVFGLDLVALAVGRARELTGARLARTVRFGQGDFLEPAAVEPASFDALFEHTCFCAIEPRRRQDYLAAAVRALRPGGWLAGVFYLDPDMDPGEEGPPFGVERQELERLGAAAGFRLVDGWTPRVAFPGRLGRERAMLWRRE